MTEKLKAGESGAPAPTQPTREAKIQEALIRADAYLQHAPHSRTGEGGVPEHNPTNCTKCIVHAALNLLGAPAPVQDSPTKPAWERLESCPECDGDGCHNCDPARSDE